VSEVSVPPAAQTSVERAYEFLRRMAVEFEIKPGERLNEGEFARLLKMSRAPVREAMNRLVSEDLLTVTPNLGFSCRRLSASEIVSLYEVRADLETAAVGRASGENLPQGIADLAALHAAMRREVRKASLDDLVDRDEAFHLRLASLSGNAERVGMLRNIDARVRFIRRISLEDPVRLKRGLDEHGAIIDCLKAGNLADAALRLRRHLVLSPGDAAAFVNQALTRIYATTVA
jgi:DNA-binding GntR family transcriptional regulator